MFFIVNANSLTPPPVCPSKLCSTVSTSPVTLNVVALVSLSALPAFPLTLPLTCPSKFPKKVVA